MKLFLLPILLALCDWRIVIKEHNIIALVIIVISKKGD